ncbi:ribonucleoside-diphosphate reductase, adenosylcobalamin-dependent [candidate division WWE3 bacterium CG08_land_8_20_14_0_20_41_10]|uniref:Vitamin B12-dependent ribonucleotide reductase n=2 Tax=Bacteria candidate phyla TaxID=1783234 RepID=A0A2H0XCF9_UNCKA|nr:MAG: ribonucleoside-diphosphate reductase, adenosylcobalamin-dependent [candidate division WWE3 bacterium CG08_land_8_20_14_0_20_41_10]
MKKAKKALSKDNAVDFTPNSLKILEKRYLLKDQNGVVAETVEGMFERIAKVVASPDAQYGYEEKSQIEFYNLISSKKFFPNSPTFTGAGTPLGQLAACFVLPIEDDLGKHPDGIFSTLRNAALIQQVGGGNGFSFSDLRPKGTLVKSSMGKATGPVGFLAVYDKAFGEVAQGGVRRGANMAVLQVNHPDIRDFIKCKSDEGEISNFNISVAVTDEFMQAVKDDKKFDLIDPHSKKVVESPRAREIFEMIVEYAYKNGEPGVLFIDEANRYNPVPHLYNLKATNPCGEQWLGKYENCCLGSINLLEHLDKDGQVDWESLKETTILSTRFLDNVVTANKYVDAVPQLRQAAENCRRIGLGFMGLADVMYSLGVRYGSEEGCDFAGQVTEFIRYHSTLASIDLAKERGTFPAIKGSIFDAKKLKWQAPKPIKPFKKDFSRPKLDWDLVRAKIVKYGIRNAARTTVAPTGTISTVAGVEGYGCEPAFALAYSRNVYQAAGDEEKLTLTYVSPLFDKALNSLNLKEESKKKIVERVLETGSCRDILDLPEKIRNTFVVSADVLPEEHIKMQASIQAFIDNSISKTCNFPPTAKKEDIAKVYMLGWEMGCKGLTVYVAGSRQEVVLETKETRNKKDGKVEAVAVVEPVKKEMERGYRLTGTTYKLDTPQGKAFITVNKDAEGSPMEVFANVGKAGSDVAALSEALGRLISGWLRVSENPLRTAKEIVVQLLGIGGSRSVGFGSKRVSSIPDAVAKVLAEDCDFHVRSNGANVVENGVDKKEVSVFSHVNMCPECGNSSFINEEGCSKCYECGYSVC